MTDARRDVRVFAGLEALSEAAANEIVAIARQSVADRGRFTIALSGGNTPKRTHELLAERHQGEIDWLRTEILFGDERFVSSDDPRSNYRMARETLLEPAGISADHVHAIPTNVASVAAASERYERTLRDVAAASDGSPSIDLILLGVGPDGHTASLFPGSPALGERRRWTRAVDAPATVQPAVPRVTVTFPFLNAARNLLFLVAGADKRPVLTEILGGTEAGSRYPAAMVNPSGRALWLIEQSAAPAPLT
jgi:6-phosphogluconolactonase